VFFYQLFDLFLNEFEYFKKGLMDETRFSNWMRWRWTDYNDKRHENPIPFNIDAFGKSYKEEWKFLVSDNRRFGLPIFLSFCLMCTAPAASMRLSGLSTMHGH
jgi:hypothetical protein